MTTGTNPTTPMPLRQLSPSNLSNNDDKIREMDRDRRQRREGTKRQRGLMESIMNESEKKIKNNHCLVLFADPSPEEEEDATLISASSSSSATSDEKENLLPSPPSGSENILSCTLRPRASFGCNVFNHFSIPLYEMSIDEDDLPYMPPL